MTGLKIKPKDGMSSFTMSSTFQKAAPDGVTQGADMYLKFELSFVSESANTATLPDAPTSLSAVSPKSTQINLSWNAPTNTGGADISGYKIEKSTDGGTIWSILDANTKSTSTSYTEGGLTNGQTYHYQVYAINSKGASATASDPASAVPLDVPSKPLSVTASLGASGEVVLTWSAPSNDGGSAVTDYLIHYSTDLQLWNTFADGTGIGTTATVTGLVDDTSYIFRVFAVNSAGTVHSSDLVSETPTTAADKPSGLSTIATSTAQINLSWTAPGGATITGYQIERQFGTLLDTNWAVLVTNTGSTATTYSDTGLFGGTTYSYRVSGITGTDTVGTASSGSQATTHSVPDAPSGMTATSLPSKYVLSWSAPANDGGVAIEDYFIQYSTDGGTNWNPLTDGTNTKTSITASTNVQNGVEYTLRVYAVNTIGSSASSPTVTVTPLTIPTEPRSVKAVPAAGEVALSWAAPSSTGGAAITDYIVKVSSDSGATFTTFADGTGTGLSATVTSLTDGNAYQFRVAAVNSEGTGPASTGTTVTAGVGTVDDADDFESIEVNFLMGPKDGSIHPTVPTNIKTTDFQCPEPQVFFITDNNETVFTDITIVRATSGDTTSACAYTSSLPHFSTYGVNAINSKFAVGAAGLAVGSLGNVPIPPLITGLAMYSFGAPELNDDGQLVFSKIGSYQSLPEYSQTLPTTTLNVGERSQIAVRIFDYNGPQSVEHVGLFLNLHGVAYESEDSDTYILYDHTDEVEEFSVVDPTGLLSDVNVSFRIEDTILWVLFDMTFEKEMDTSTINVNAWNSHRARAEVVAYEILRVSDYIPGLEQITGTSDAKSTTDTNFYVVESAPNNCEVCISPYAITLSDNEIEWTNHDESIRTIISGDAISGFDGLFKSNFIFQDNSYSTTIEDTDYYTIYDILEEQYHSTMLVEVSGDPITDARLLENPTMPFNHHATKITSGSSAGLFAMDVSIPDTIRVFGTIYDVDTRQVAFLDVLTPDGTEINLKLSTNSEGDFSTIQNIP
ncbi:MAG: fibronectin type III domain-containing protein, partial [Robiginitomaculum sp.]|nr:fibronectin type III domain-containing protein [Robiginitomaculum sp.]